MLPYKLIFLLYLFYDLGTHSNTTSLFGVFFFFKTKS